MWLCLVFRNKFIFYVIRIIKSRRMRWAGHVARKPEPEGKRPLGRPRRGWVDNIRMDLGEVE
jgi:hypothetical protein